MSRARNRHQVLGGIGSYWGEHIHEDSEQLLRSFVHLPDVMNFQSVVDDVRYAWAGVREIPFENSVLAFDPDTVVEFGADQQVRLLEQFVDASVGAVLTVYRKPTEYDILQGFAPLGTEIDGYVISSESCDYLVWPIPSVETPTDDPNILQNSWEVAIPYGIYPEAIMVAGEILTAGIDFKVFQGAIQFQENPHSMFPDRKMYVLQGRRTITNPLNHALNIDEVSADVSPVSRFFREVTNPKSLQLAVAAASGMVVLPQTGILLDYRTECGRTSYMFDWGVITVPYGHDALTIGQSYEKDTVVGDLITVYGPTGNPGWFTNISWPDDGMSLDRFGPFKGLTAPNSSVKFWAYDQTGSKLHVRAQLLGDADVQDRYWTHVKGGEIASGNYINDILGLAAMNDSVQLNPIEFYFRNFLADRLLVVELRTRGIEGPIHERALSFLTEHRIIGSLITIIES